VVVNYLHDQQAAESVVETVLAAGGTRRSCGLNANRAAARHVRDGGAIVNVSDAVLGPTMPT
jgi:hypothetical protein